MASTGLPGSGTIDRRSGSDTPGKVDRYTPAFRLALLVADAYVQIHVNGDAQWRTKRLDLWDPYPRIMTRVSDPTSSLTTLMI